MELWKGKGKVELWKGKGKGKMCNQESVTRKDV